jgi:hypothetical protein
MKKYAFIIDSYPSSEEQRNLLLSNLKLIKSKGIDVLLTSHHACNSEIIENSTYFLFEKKNEYHFLDSEILNENIKEVRNPVYLKYNTVGTETFYDRLVITGWSVAITSQLFNAIKFLYGKGYDYAFYLVDDFICPDDIVEKINSILEKSKDKKNYFVKNSPMFSSWYAGFFFGFTIDNELINKIPNLDFSDNKIYQKYFPNCSGEDVMLRIWPRSDESNYIDEHEELNNIFGENKWNLNSSVIKPGPSQLNNTTCSSIYANKNLDNKYCLLLQTYWDCLYPSVTYDINITDKFNNVLYNMTIDLQKGHWFKDYLDRVFDNNDIVIFNKTITSSDKTCTISDSIIIDKRDINSYSLLKKFEQI